MNTLLRQSDRPGWRTNLREVFHALGGRQREFDWLITDLQLSFLGPPVRLHAPPPLPSALARGWAVRIAGDDLTRIVESFEIQWTWAVLSGFPHGTTFDPEQVDPYPCADGNTNLWLPDVTLQHPLAIVEIVCWDGSDTLLLSRDDDLSRRFRAHYPEAVDLNEHNRRGA